MRPIEFRAWDVEENRWLTPSNCEPHEIYGPINWLYLHGITELNVDGDYILEQFTGLTDKNGVKIFEGDVVKFDWSCMDYCEPEEEPDIRVDVVVFAHATFKLRLTRMWKDGLHDWESLENVEPWAIEVLGNIHESGHLLDNSE